MTTTAHRPGLRGPLRSMPARRLAPLTVVWLLLYAAARLVLMTVDGLGPLSATGPDLIAFAGLSGVAILVVAAVTVGVQARVARTDAPTVLVLLLTAVGALASAALMIAAATILLDLVGLLVGLGVEFHPLGALIRAGCVLAAVLVAVHTRRFWTAAHPSRAHRRVPMETPRWVVAVGYLAVAACLVRLVAQIAVGFETFTSDGGAALIVFEAGFLLAGILLPLALVHRWGRVWPAWVPVLRGRRVPRMLLIGSGGVLGVGMCAYFGMTTLHMLITGLGGHSPFATTSAGPEYPAGFYWTSVLAYLVWGIGLVVCTLSYTSVSARDGAGR